MQPANALPPVKNLAPLPADVAAQVGDALGGRRHSFTAYSEAKGLGMFRIGCFGDSFTYGTEAADGLEYAAALEDVLHARGHPEVEVLNFGTPGFGLHQSYLMWDRVGRRYGLDRVVLLAKPDIWASRDTTFTFWSPPAARLGFHARFVRDGGGLRLIEPVGRDENERQAAYTRFVPPLRYLRYDRRPPLFLTAWLPTGRTIANPFYYERSDIGREAFATYRVLLGRLAEEAIPSVIVTTDPVSASVVERRRGNLRALAATVGKGFLYEAASGHYTPWAHRLLAEQLATALGYDERERPSVVEFTDLPADPGEPDGTAAAPGAFEGVTLALEDEPVALFHQFTPGSFFVSPLKRLPANAGSLLAVGIGEGSLLDGVFLAFGRIGTPPDLVLVVRGRRVPLRADPVDGRIGIFRIDACAPALREAARLAPDVRCVVTSPWSVLPHGAEGFTIEAGGEPVLTATVGPGTTIELHPLRPYFRVRADGSRAALPDLADEGTARFLFTRRDAEPLDVPVARWRRRALPAEPAAR
ncbi:MAG TPA: SGNH/GDSL hydrolase family protein [Candidatus Binatia bacterium]|nr:SGNH/GDSL hydrolase family protein [Candidatus Binatia bacterium]